MNSWIDLYVLIKFFLWGYSFLCRENQSKPQAKRASVVTSLSVQTRMQWTTGTNLHTWYPAATWYPNRGYELGPLNHLRPLHFTTTPSLDIESNSRDYKRGQQTFLVKDEIANIFRPLLQLRSSDIRAQKQPQIIHKVMGIIMFK